MRQAYLQFKAPDNTTMLTIGVECAMQPPKHKNIHKTGYGKDIPTDYKIRYLNKWRRVYSMIYSNVGKLYVYINKEQVTILIR